MYYLLYFFFRISSCLWQPLSSVTSRPTSHSQKTKKDNKNKQINTLQEENAAGFNYCLYAPVVDDMTVHYPVFDKRTKLSNPSSVYYSTDAVQIPIHVPE